MSGINRNRETIYLWYLGGRVFTAAGRCVGRFDSLDAAARYFPVATFRITDTGLDNPLTLG